jgi:hypothetical protein
MRPSDRSLDDEIAEVERRLTQQRAQLHALAVEARSRVSMKNAVPVALAAALAVGFAASRFVRRPPPVQTVVRTTQPRSRMVRLTGTLASVLLPRLLRPLQAVATEWLQQRMHRPRASR